MRHIEPIGLMTMAPLEVEAEQSRPVFRGLRELRDQLNDRSSASQTDNGVIDGDVG